MYDACMNEMLYDMQLTRSDIISFGNCSWDESFGNARTNLMAIAAKGQYPSSLSSYKNLYQNMGVLY